MKRSCGSILCGGFATLVLCRCGSAAFSPAADGGSAASPDAASDVIIVVRGDATGAPDAIGADCSAPTTLECSGSCVDPTLPANCGSCGNSCFGPEAGAGAATCTNGACTVGCEADGSTPLNCSGACVDPTQPANCGACGNSCAGPPSTQGQAVCSLDGGGLPVDAGGDGGPCGITCNATYHACGADCLSDTGDPSADPCVVSNATGVFVAPDPLGTVTGAGTMASPLLTVSAGITKALTGKKRVYVCLGTYGETVSLTSSADGLTVYGGLDCANGWKYVGSSGATATVVATPAGTPAPATALTVTGPMTSGVAFEDVGFTSLDGVNPGDSSVTVFATTSAKLTLTRGTVTAGRGVTGSAGGTTVNWSGVAQAGQPPTGLLAGTAGGSNECFDASSSNGGAGGPCTADSSGNLSCSQGVDGSSSVGLDHSGGQAGSGGPMCDPGTAGDPGTPSALVGVGAASIGSVMASGWTLGAIGGHGNNGAPAYGGGGGGGSSAAIGGGGGGGGGSGGCGGGQGLGGNGGGSSIGLVSYQSAIALSTVEVVTAAGGAGGAGGAGQTGQPGGAGFSLAAPRCGGGVGGKGGDGAGGGGGAGGNSLGVAWLGSTGPSVDGTVISQDQPTIPGITVGTAGSAGTGGTPVAVAGSAKAIQQFQ